MSAKPVILFESYPDFNGSALEIFRECIKRDYESQYDLKWAVGTNCIIPQDKACIKLFNANNGFQLVKNASTLLRNVKCIIDSNRYIPKMHGAYRFHARHGCCLKNTISYNRGIGNLDGILTTSEQMLELDRKIFPPEIRDKFVITGMPATDRLFSPSDLYNTHFLTDITGISSRYDKIIGWLPTYRDHRFSNSKSNRFPYGLPAIHSIDEYNATNDILKMHNILLIVQMHHAQANNYKHLPKASNIVFVNETIKQSHHIATTDILGNCDALLTDYSSAYHEYLILNRPIGLCIEDIVEFSDTNGFFCFYPEWIRGDYIITNTHLLQWIDNIAHGLDISKLGRQVSLNMIHKYKDNKCTARVLNYIEQGANL
jgi:CDP-glycerol glycerophosphotransferase (TagB/SpsB family)